MSTLTNTLPETLLRSVEDAYGRPPRAYHSWTHVQEVFRHLASVPSWAHPREVELAALFHDAVYEAGRSDNEAKSANLAASAIAQFIPNAGIDVAYVRRLIELTACHGKLEGDGLDEDARHFLDADMAILGSEPAAFDAYNDGIAREYGHIPKLVFDFNRRRFLKKLLEAPRIFLSAFFHARFDAAARANLRRALNE